MNIICLKERPEYQQTAIDYIQSKWPMVWPQMDQYCISHSIIPIHLYPDGTFCNKTLKSLVAQV